MASNETDIKPGSNNAVLTLANGRRIILNDSHNGIVSKEDGITIARSRDGQLHYIITEKNEGKINDFHTIETPNGGQHSVLLPDGTNITLNAASTLKYPTSFVGANERIVELTGEGYFEVSKDPKKPFIVKTKNEEVKVLGTHFNINSYSDEQESKTTLIEGSVKVSKIGKPEVAKMLRPGQQSTISRTEFNIHEVDVETEAAWRNGEFIFTGQNLSIIMRMISRWYDVDIRYGSNHIDQLQIEGQVSRARNLSVVLKSLEELSGIKFKLKGREVTISN